MSETEVNTPPPFQEENEFDSENSSEVQYYGEVHYGEIYVYLPSPRVTFRFVLPHFASPSEAVSRRVEDYRRRVTPLLREHLTHLHGQLDYTDLIESFVQSSRQDADIIAEFE